MPPLAPNERRRDRMRADHERGSERRKDKVRSLETVHRSLCSRQKMQRQEPRRHALPAGCKYHSAIRALDRLSLLGESLTVVLRVDTL